MAKTNAWRLLKLLQIELIRLWTSLTNHSQNNWRCRFNNLLSNQWARIDQLLKILSKSTCLKTILMHRLKIRVQLSSRVLAFKKVAVITTQSQMWAKVWIFFQMLSVISRNEVLFHHLIDLWLRTKQTIALKTILLCSVVLVKLEELVS